MLQSLILSPIRAPFDFVHRVSSTVAREDRVLAGSVDLPFGISDPGPLPQLTGFCVRRRKLNPVP
jgi:hypothetical protein